MKNLISKYLESTSKAAPLAAFRILFGLMMFASIIRFWWNGWIEKLYIEPHFFFKYYGFEFVQPLGNYTYFLFVICALSSLAITIGWKYRLAIILFFLSFTYIELMDLTTYLNHYYFISVLSFLMIFLPAGSYFSVDAYKNPNNTYEYIPSWCIDSIKVLLSIVYIYAGLAKLNSDWLFHAMPLSIWLPSNYDIPVLGELLQKRWLMFGFSWIGAIYDLSIPFLLFYKRSRIFAFALVVIFHALTRILFPIGMFPYIMIVSAIIFFEPQIHLRLLNTISTFFRIPLAIFNNGLTLQNSMGFNKMKLSIIGLFFLFQFLIPFRYLMYPGELFWTEEGYRFSWRVMLMEKAGYANFKIINPENGESFYIDNDEFLSSFQQKQMASQPDMILQYAHFLKRHVAEEGIPNAEVYVESYVALNGRRSKTYIDPNVDLGKIKDSFAHKSWILNFGDEIKGL